MTPANVDSVSWMRTALACVVVAALLALMGFVLKYLKLRGYGMQAGGSSRRLQVVEQLMVDARRRLVIVRCDQAEHLLLLGANEDVVVEANLEHHAAPMRTKSGA